MKTLAATILADSGIYACLGKTIHALVILSPSLKNAAMNAHHGSLVLIELLMFLCTGCCIYMHLY